MFSFCGTSEKNLRRLLLTFVSVVLLVLLGCSDASRGGNPKNGNNGIKFEVYNLPAIQWACEPFLEPKERKLNPIEERTKDLCMKLRGGKLVEGTDNEVIDINDSGLDGIAENSSSSIDESSITLLEKEESGEETDTTKSDDSSTESSIIEPEEVNQVGQKATVIETDDSNTIVVDEETSTSDERQYVPSAKPTPSVADTKSQYTFSVFQEGDGHETDPDGIPARYMKMQNDNRELAKAALEKTLEWRKENDIDTILSRPHPKFDVSKAVFPHYFCGRDDTGHVILLQRPGLMNVKLAHKNDLTGEDLLLHYIYVMEYLWRIVDPTPGGTMTSIIDLTEMNISILRKREQLRIGSLFLSTMDAHFPQRSHRTFLINAPKWFGALYKLCSPLLRESTKEKIQILSKGKEQDEVLKHLLQDCPIPEGEKYENVPAGIMEEELRDFCMARLEDAGVAMQTVEPV